ncbi:phage protein U [Sphingobium sp. B1D7B]|uniref:phage tail protein n=1 Tax=Sphingobium TaxID=165695 RepID=UPI0015EC0762|nr:MULTISPECIES: phage tail protein [Sphingobium]MCW2362437.1 phage protein U [Sphingobium sp. B10D3B]MCW2395164.1 phage protein U [Sphingobium sp. B8D3B]MCW2400883.1 phage protein U [Sphingobium sp. B10D7B]MCW2405278.1 phage protein U [Sphingobium sp. B1D7B]MCW2407862.1 phage protein U [Sphingobium xanthum]
MMMSLDTFLFEIGTLPYEQLAQTWNWRHAKSERFGARAASQFLGPGDETMRLTGRLFPGVAGDYSSLERIREMADTGESYTLLSGRQEVLGQFTIRSLEQSSDTFLVDGFPRRANFTLELERVD